jgi:hypothetical protein
MRVSAHAKALHKKVSTGFLVIDKNPLPKSFYAYGNFLEGSASLAVVSTGTGGVNKYF